MKSEVRPPKINFVIEGKDKPSYKEKNLLYQGDTLAFLKGLPSKKRFQLIVTSPPYNIGKEYEKPQKFEEYLEGQREFAAFLTKHLSDSGSLCWQVGNFVQNGEKIPLDIFFIPMFRELGLKLRNRIVWKFGHGQTGDKRRFSGRFETILWFTKSEEYKFNLDPVRRPQKYPSKRASKGPRGPIRADRDGFVTWTDFKKNNRRRIYISKTKKGKKHLLADIDIKRVLSIKERNTKVSKGSKIVLGLPSGNRGGKNPGDVWDEWDKTEHGDEFDIPNVKANHVEKTSHPCQFPIELVERLILALTNKRDLVFDPFSGVGSSGCAALKNDRYFWGCDKEKEYNVIAMSRLNLAIKNSSSLPYRPMNKDKYNHLKSPLSKKPPEWLEDS